MHRAYVALGANLGDPGQTLRNALSRLGEHAGLTPVRSSSLYRTAPLGLLDQPEFVNAVAAFDTSLDPLALLQLLLSTESAFGRIRRDRDGPRNLDLDLLLFDDIQLDLPELTLPHPRMHLRAFVIVPLCEIAPEIVIPGRGRAADWLPSVAGQVIGRLP